MGKHRFGTREHVRVTTDHDRELAVLGSGQLIGAHGAALHQEIGLGNVVEVWEGALGAFFRERVDRAVEHIPAIHAVVRGGDVNAPHSRNLDG